MPARSEFQRLFDGYVARYRARDAAGCASFFAADAQLLSPYGPLATGREAIADTHREWVSEGADGKTIEVVDAGVSGDLGWCLALYGEGSTGNGTSLNVLARQPDGTWLITHCSLNETQ